MNKKGKKEEKIIKDFVKSLTEDAKNLNDMCPKWYIIDYMNDYLKTKEGEPMLCLGDVWRPYKKLRSEWTAEAFKLFYQWLDKKDRHIRW